MDLKKFQKIAEDKHCVTMKHADGHEMKILLKALSPVEKEQIKMLKMAKGGSVKRKMYADSDEAVSKDDSAPTTDLKEPELGSQYAAPQSPVTVNVGTPAQADNQSQQSSSVDTNVPNVRPAGNQVNSGGYDTAANPMIPIQTLQQANKDQAAIDAEKARRQADQEAEYLKERQRLANLDQEHYNELKGHTEDFNDYVQKNPINPKAYQENMGTGQKIAAGIGLALGGFSVPFGGHNFAFDALNKQIDRNIAAQQQNTQNKHTVWAAYENLYGDSNIATNLAKVSALDMLDHQQKATAAQLGTAQAMVNSNKMSAETALAKNELLAHAAGRLGDLRAGIAQPNGPSAPKQQAPPQGPPNISNGPPGIQRELLPQPPINGVDLSVPTKVSPTNANVGISSSDNGRIAPDQANESQPDYKVPGSSVMLAPAADDFIKRMKYNDAIPEDQKATMLKEYETQKNAEAGMRQVDQIFPRLKKEATYGGYALDKASQIKEGLGNLGNAVEVGGAYLAGKVGLKAASKASQKAAELIGKGGIRLVTPAVEKEIGAAAAKAAPKGIIPLTTAAIATLGAGAYLYMTKDQRIQYDSDKVALKSALATALKGVPGYGGDASVNALVDANTPTVFDSKADLDRKANNIKDIVRLHTTSSLLKTRGLSNN